MGAFFSIFFFTSKSTRLYFSDKPAIVSVAKSENTEEISLEDVVKRFCPTVHRPFACQWWLPNGHLQTLYCAFGDFTKVDVVEYERTLLRTADGGTLGLDFTPPSGETRLAKDAPILVVIPGLTGGSYESYVRAVLAPACRPVDEGGLGYRAVVLNFRGCAGVPLTSPHLYSAGSTVDIRAALLHISTRYPNAQLLGLGFSLGASVLTRYLAEEGTRSRLKAACVLGCPWDIRAICEWFKTNWLPQQIYAKSLGQNLQRIAKLHSAQLSVLPHVAEAVSRISAIWRPTMLQFDKIVTTVAGGSCPPFPFSDVDDYYRWASTQNVMNNIRVPVLALHAADDPIITILPLDTSGFSVNPWIVFAVTSGGGHLGWFERNTSHRMALKRWYIEPTLDWLRTAVEKIDVSTMTPPRSIIESEGMLREEGLPHIGCQVISSGNWIPPIGSDASGLVQGL